MKVMSGFKNQLMFILTVLVVFICIIIVPTIFILTIKRVTSLELSLGANPIAEFYIDTTRQDHLNHSKIGRASNG